MPVDPDAAEELHQFLMKLFPEPVDLFEDELAAELGLYRHPAMDEAEWRRVRVRAIESREAESACSGCPD